MLPAVRILGIVLGIFSGVHAHPPLPQLLHPRNIHARNSPSSPSASTPTPTPTSKSLPPSTIFIIVILILLVLGSIPLIWFIIVKRRMASELASGEIEIPKEGLKPKTPKHLRPIINPGNAKFFSPGRDREEATFKEARWEEVELGRYGVKVKIKEKPPPEEKEVKEPERVRVRWGGRWGPLGA